MRLLFTALALVLLLAPVASRQLTAIRVSGGEDLQAAIDVAKPGDLILLASGAEFRGNFVLRKHGDTPSFVTIRTDAEALPGPGVRTGPEYSGTLASLRSPNNMPALRTEPGAHHWRIANIELRANAGGDGNVIALGDDRRQTQLGTVPHDIVLDRVYLHGGEDGQKRGIALNSASTEIVNSYIANIWAPGQDSQAIAGWNGPGPYLIENNYLEAASENILFGGSDPVIDGLVPQDIRIRRNHLSKRVEWRGSNRNVKNLFELKNARNVELDGNILEYNWAGAQDGYAILIKPENQNGGAPWTTIENVRITNNLVRHVSAAVNISGIDTSEPSARASGILIRNNLFLDVSSDRWGGPGDFIKIGNAPLDVVVEGNTVVNDGRILNVYGGKAEGFVFRNNVVRHNRYGVKGQGTRSGQATIERFFPGAVFQGNVIGGGRARYPEGNRRVDAGDVHGDASFDGAGVNRAALRAAIGPHTSEADAPARGPQSTH